MNPILVSDRDSLPFKKREQKVCSLLQEQQCDAANFKAPYPYKTKYTGPFQPVPRRIPALYQPWIHTPTRSKPHTHSAFREHHGWTEWREFSPLHPGWDFSQHYQNQSHLSGTAAFLPGPLPYASRYNALSLLPDGFQRVRGGYDCEKTLKDKGLSSVRQSYVRHKGPYVKRGDRKMEYCPRVEKTSPPASSMCLPHSQEEDFKLQPDPLHKTTKTVSGHSFMKVSPVSSDSTHPSTKEHSTAASSQHAPSSASPNRFPWLLPHFVAGSLIELRDGRLRRVEQLQTEDFLLGSLACPDLRLSCCTVQSISPSASCSSISRLLILLHDQQSQEMVDVYMEYPFFVRGRGWSSCSPQRTARLCGLQCRQLNVGDVCLALTPVSSPLSATLEQKSSPKKLEEGGKPLKAPHLQSGPCFLVPPGPKQPETGQRTGAGTVRRRHYSAPELRGPGTNCM